MTTQEIKTREIVTPLGNKFILKEYITYGQHREIMDIYLSDKNDNDKVNTLREAEIKGFNFVVVSINEKTENLYDMFLEMPMNDVKEINKIIKETISPKD